MSRLFVAWVLGLVALVSLLTFPAGVASADVENVTVYNAGDGTLDGDDVRSGIAADEFEAVSQLVTGETLVVEIRSERLAADLDSADGSPTDRFFHLLDEDFSLRFVHEDPLPGSPVRTARPANPDQFDENGSVRVGQLPATVVRAGETTYVVLETRPGVLPLDPNTDPTFVAVVGYDAAVAGIPEGYEGPEFTWYPSEAVFDRVGGADAGVLPPEIVEFRITRSVDSGESLQVRALRDGRVETTVDVTADGSAIVNLRSFQPGDDATLELRAGEAVVDEIQAEVHEPAADLSDVSLVESADGLAVQLTANLSHGGAIEVRNETGVLVGIHPGPGSFDGMPAGVERTVTVQLDGQVTDELVVRAVRADSAVDQTRYDADRTLDVSESDRPEERTPADEPAHADERGSGFHAGAAALAFLLLAIIARSGGRSSSF